MRQIGANDPQSFFQFLYEQGYRAVRVLPNGDIAVLNRLMFTVAILSRLNAYGAEDRWCYHTAADALRAYLAWSGEDGTEPGGWHRHPNSGRRRKDGDPGTEYVAL